MVSHKDPNHICMITWVSVRQISGAFSALRVVHTALRRFCLVCYESRVLTKVQLSFKFQRHELFFLSRSLLIHFLFTSFHSHSFRCPASRSPCPLFFLSSCESSFLELFFWCFSFFKFSPYFSFLLVSIQNTLSLRIWVHTTVMMRCMALLNV